MSASSSASITEALNGAVGLVVVMSGLLAGVTRSLAILAGLSAKEVDRVTAMGFLAGAGVAMMMLSGELIWR
jgi:type IV secretory pathway TrbD component